MRCQPLAAQRGRGRVEHERRREPREGRRVEWDVRCLLAGGPPGDAGERHHGHARVQQADSTRGDRGHGPGGHGRSVTTVLRPSPVYDDVHRVVLAVGPGDAEEEARASARSRAGPPPASSPAEDERPPDLVEVDAALAAATPLTNTSKDSPDLGRQLHLAPRVPRSIRCHSACAGPLFATLATSSVALVATAVAYAGNGGFLPGEPHSPNAHRITDAFIFVSIFTGVDLPDRRGRADRLHRQVPPRQARRAPPTGRRSTAPRAWRSIWTVDPGR